MRLSDPLPPVGDSPKLRGRAKLLHCIDLVCITYISQCDSNVWESTVAGRRESKVQLIICNWSIYQVTITNVFSNMSTAAPGEGWIKRYVSHARFSDELWVLACNMEYRRKLMTFIVERKIMANVDISKGIVAADGLNLRQLLALLVAI